MFDYLHYRAVILAALPPEKKYHHRIATSTPAPAISDPVNHFSQE